MQIALFDDYRLGVVEGDRVADVTDALLERDPEWPFAFVPRTIMRFDQVRPRIEKALPGARRLPLSNVKLRPPVPAPSKILAAASNYGVRRAREADPSAPPKPPIPHLSQPKNQPPGTRGEVFPKGPSSIIGPGDTIPLPDTMPGRPVQHQPELTAVIGKECYRVSPSRALDYVFGYVALMDITVTGPGDRSQRKSYRGFSPIGPWITLKEEVPDPQNLDLKILVNGEVRQQGNTRDMTETLAEVIEFASYCYTLMPGDLIATGSPAGNGDIVDGDRVTIEIERLGQYTVNVKAM